MEHIFSATLFKTVFVQLFVTHDITEIGLQTSPELSLL